MEFTQPKEQRTKRGNEVLSPPERLAKMFVINENMKDFENVTTTVTMTTANNTTAVYTSPCLGSGISSTRTSPSTSHMGPNALLHHLKTTDINDKVNTSLGHRSTEVNGDSSYVNSFNNHASPSTSPSLDPELDKLFDAYPGDTSRPVPVIPAVSVVDMEEDFDQTTVTPAAQSAALPAAAATPTPPHFLASNTPLDEDKVREALGVGGGGELDISNMLVRMTVLLDNRMSDNTANFQQSIDMQNTLIGQNATKITEVSKVSSTNSTRIQELEDQNSALEARVSRLELYSRRMNLVISGVPEVNKDLPSWFHQTFLDNLGLIPNKPKETTDSKGNITVETYTGPPLEYDIIHRLGKDYSQINKSSPTRKAPRPRKILIKFKTHNDRNKVWSKKRNLGGTGVYVEEHLTEEMELKRKPLYQIAAIASQKKCKAMVKEDYLLIDGIKYTEQNLHLLPGNLQDARFHHWKTPGQVSFLGYKCPLSNFYRCKFKHNGNVYSSTEQFIQISKAQMFAGNEELIRRMRQTHDPLKLKGMGSRLNNYDNDQWKSEAIKVLYPGIKDKFVQDQTCKDFLINTGKRLIVEASESDTLFGIGQSIRSNHLHEPSTHLGENIQGKMLMTIREELQDM